MKNLMKKVAAWSSETKVGVVIGLVAVVFFSTLALTQPTGGEIPYSSSNTTSNVTTSSSIKPVFDPLEEVMAKPFTASVSVVRYYFDVNAPLEQLEEASVFYNNKWEPSRGMDFALTNTQFDVTASLSGIVTAKTSDPIFGLTVTIVSAEDIELQYSSLSMSEVQVGAEIKKGDVIGKAGEAVFGSDLGQNHLHFRMKIDGNLVNPNLYFDKAVKDMQE